MISSGFEFPVYFLEHTKRYLSFQKIFPQKGSYSPNPDVFLNANCEPCLGCPPRGLKYSMGRDRFIRKITSCPVDRLVHVLQDLGNIRRHEFVANIVNTWLCLPKQFLPWILWQCEQKILNLLVATSTFGRFLL